MALRDRISGHRHQPEQVVDAGNIATARPDRRERCSLRHAYVVDGGAIPFAHRDGGRVAGSSPSM